MIEIENEIMRRAREDDQREEERDRALGKAFTQDVRRQVAIQRSVMDYFASTPRPTVPRINTGIA